MNRQHSLPPCHCRGGSSCGCKSGDLPSPTPSAPGSGSRTASDSADHTSPARGWTPRSSCPGHPLLKRQNSRTYVEPSVLVMLETQLMLFELHRFVTLGTVDCRNLKNIIIKYYKGPPSVCVSFCNSQIYMQNCYNKDGCVDTPSCIFLSITLHSINSYIFIFS